MTIALSKFDFFIVMAGFWRVTHLMKNIARIRLQINDQITLSQTRPFSVAGNINKEAISIAVYEMN